MAEGHRSRRVASLLAPSALSAAMALTMTLMPAPAAAQSTGAEVAAAVDGIAPRLVELRHDLHRNPELSNRETRTAGVVARELRRLGLEVREGIAHTGVVGILRGGKPGPVVGVRADMDALPVTEETDLAFRSTVRTEYLGRGLESQHRLGMRARVDASLYYDRLLDEPLAARTRRSLCR